MSSVLHVSLADLNGSFASGWADVVAPLVAAVEGFLPAGALVSVDARNRHLSVSWSAGPPPFEVVSLVSDVIGKSPNYQQDDDWAWPGLSGTFVRTSPASATGFALLSGALAGACPRCEYVSESFAYAFDEALGRPDPHLLASHPNLVALSALGLSPSTLTALADVIGGLCESERSSAERFFHERGHLPGLVELSGSLTAP